MDISGGYLTKDMNILYVEYCKILFRDVTEHEVKW